MVRDGNRALMYAVIRRPVEDYIHADFQAEMPDLTTYILHMEIPKQDFQMFLKIAEFLKAANKNYGILLTTPCDSDTIPPCDSHPETSPNSPPPATSATC
jgi:hypothetical protein